MAESKSPLPKGEQEKLEKAAEQAREERERQKREERREATKYGSLINDE